MLAELVGWYTGRDQNRRRYPRIKRNFEVEYSIDGVHWASAQGLDLSGGGMCIAREHAIPQVTFDVNFEIDGDRIHAKVHPVWTATTRMKGKDIPCYGVQFVSINAEDWEALIYSITGDDPSKAENLEPVPIEDTAVNFLLPAEFQSRLLHELETHERYDSKKPAPVHFEYGGLMHKAEHPMHRFTVHSSVTTARGVQRYTTRLLVHDENGQVEFVA